jgi:quinol monooxygenase YgiN
MGRFVIAAFKPKPGKQEQLRAVVAKHWCVLSEQGLVTDRPRYAMQSTDGTILEVFEWRSAQAIESAHQNPAVQALWAEFEAACEYVPLITVAESQDLFAEFEALPL